MQLSISRESQLQHPMLCRGGGWRRCCSCQASATICAGRSGRCRAVWRQVLAAAGLFGGKFWPLQGRLAASFAAAGLFGGRFWPLQGRREAVTLAPLLMVLLL